MKRLFLSILFVLLAATGARAATYYVAQSSAGSGNGSSYANRMSVSSHNAASFSAGDTIYLCGTITSQVTVPSSGSAAGGYITYDSYESSPAMLTANSSDGTFFATGKDYITVTGITAHDGIVGIKFLNGCDHIIIKKCTVYNMLGGESTSDGKGIIASKNDGVDNTYITIGGASGDGNTIYNVGNGSGSHDIGVSYTQHAVISYNTCYGASNDSSGIDGIIMQGTDYAIIEYNKIYGHQENVGSELGEDGMDIKGCTYALIRNNLIYDNRSQGININLDDTHQTPCNNIYITNNFIYRHRTGIILQNIVSGGNVYVWGNIAAESQGPFNGHGISCTETNSCNVMIWNNTISNCHGSEDNKFQIYTASGPTYTIKNNVLFSDTNRTLLYKSGSSGVTFSYNYGYSTAGTARVSWNSTYYNFDSISGQSNNTIGNPGLSDLDSMIFTVASSNSAVVNTGTSMGTGAITTLNIHGTAYPVYWDDVLSPNTNFTTSPPTISLVKQTDYGSWDIGAYAWTVANNSPPNGTITLPASSITVAEDDEVTLSGSGTDADEDSLTYTWVIEAGTFKAWDAGTTYDANDLVEDDDSAGDFYKSKAGSNLNHAPPNTDYWYNAESVQNPGTGVCDTAGQYTITLTVNDGTDDDPTPATRTIIVTGDSEPSETTYYLNMTGIREEYTTTNYGDVDRAYARETGKPEDRITLISVDLSGADAAQVSSAMLRLNLYRVYVNTTIGVYSSSDAFTEAGATWTKYDGSNNWTGSHGCDVLLTSSGQAAVEAGGDEWIELSSASLAAYVESKLGIGTVYLAVKNTVQDYSTVTIWSDDEGEAEDYRPQLVVTTLDDAGTTPVVSGVRCENCDGTYTTGETIGPIYVDFTESVTVTGTPILTVENVGDSGDETLNYASGSSGTSLNFGSYTVAAGDTSTGFDAVSLTLNGGTIKATDDETEVPNTDGTIDTFPTGATVGSLAYNTEIIIDTTPPEPDDPPYANATGYDDGTYTEGDAICYHLNVTESVHGSSASMWPRQQITLSYPPGTYYSYYSGMVDSDSCLFCIFPKDGWRVADLGTSGDLITTGGYLVDGAGNSIALDDPGDIADTLAVVLQYPKDFTVGTDGDLSAMASLAYPVPSDTFVISNVTESEAVGWADYDGGDGTEIDITVNGTWTLTGSNTIGDYYHLAASGRSATMSGTLTTGTYFEATNIKYSGTWTVGANSVLTRCGE